MVTAKQELFIQGKIDGLSHVDAYKAAYNTDNMTSDTIKIEAYRLAENPHVAPTIAERKAAIVAEFVSKAAWDLDRIVDELAENVIGSRRDGAWGASNTAVLGIGKAIGVISDKVDVNVTHTIKPGLSLEELEERMGRLQALKEIEAGIVDGEVVEGV